MKCSNYCGFTGVYLYLWYLPDVRLAKKRSGNFMLCELLKMLGIKKSSKINLVKRIYCSLSTGFELRFLNILCPKLHLHIYKLDQCTLGILKSFHARFLVSIKLVFVIHEKRRFRCYQGNRFLLWKRDICFREQLFPNWTSM